MTLLGAKKKVVEILESADIEDSVFEAEQLIMHLLSISLSQLRLRQNEELSNSNEQKLLELAYRRAQREPLQYIIGEWEFYSLPFKVNENVLIPRADTELLVDTALDYIGDAKDLKIIDLCSGSGCVAIAIAANTKGCDITAAEKYPATLDILKENIELNKVDVTPLLCDVLESPQGEYDLIVSNPPYIKSEVINTLEKEVLSEPRVALDGGADGLLFYKAIVELWLPHLKSGGALMVEIGYDQADEVMALFNNSGLQNIECKIDINGNQRVIIGTLPI